MGKRGSISHWLFIIVFLIAASAQAQTSFRVCVWNVENFGETDRFIDNKPVPLAMKPEKEIQSMMAILKRIQPDIVGFEEILQSPDDRYVNLIKKRLKEAGFDYPYSSTTQGEDTRIQNLLLSKYPIVSEEPLNQDTFTATLTSASTGEKERITMRMSRGIINSVIEIAPHYRIRIMQVHLKSKRKAPQLDDPETKETGDLIIRRHEAVILRNAIMRILDRNPHEKLLVMGDFNDTPRSTPMKTILGTKSATHRLFDLWLKDYLGDWWTHFYFPEKEYSRIDYMIVSEELFHDFQAERSYIYRQKPEDGPEFNTYTPSDHRPLVAEFEIKP